MAPRKPKCKTCGKVDCPCPLCHIACGLDHSPTLPEHEFPTEELCNPHCPEESWLPAMVGLPGMKGASMALPVAYLKQWSKRMYDWGGPPNADGRRTFYHPPDAGELNPMFAAGEWKPTPPEKKPDTGIDINRLSHVMQAEVARQVDEKRAAAAPPAPPKPRARIGRLTRFDPNEHTVTEVLAHLRTASDSEVARVIGIERETSKRAGVLKRYKEV